MKPVTESNLGLGAAAHVAARCAATCAALVLGRVIQKRKLCVYGVVPPGVAISQKAELSSAGSDANSLLWCKMPFRSYSGSRVLATAAQAVKHEGPAGIPE